MMMSKNEKINKIIAHLLEQIRDKDPESIKVAIPGFLAKKSVSYMLIREDLLYLKAAASKLIEFMNQEQRDLLLISSLWYAIIITYGKCFTENKGGFSKLTEDVLKTEENQETHDRLMDLRHSFIAHRGKTEKEIGFIYMRLPNNEPITSLTEFRIQTSKTYFPNDGEVERYLHLFDHLIEAVNEKIQIQTQKTHDALMAMFTVEELLLMRF